MPVIIRALTFAGRFIGTALRYGKDLPSRVSRAAKMAKAGVKEAKAERLEAKAAQARKAAKADKASAASTAGTAKGAAKSSPSSSGNPVGVKDVGKKEFRDALKEGLVSQFISKSGWGYIGKGIELVANYFVGGVGYGARGLWKARELFRRRGTLVKLVKEEHGAAQALAEADGKLVPENLNPTQYAARVKAKRVGAAIITAGYAGLYGAYAYLAPSPYERVARNLSTSAFQGAIGQLPKAPEYLKGIADLVDYGGAVVEDKAALAVAALKDNRASSVPLDIKQSKDTEKRTQEAIKARLAAMGIGPARFERYTSGRGRTWWTMTALARASVDQGWRDRLKREGMTDARSIAEKHPRAIKAGFRAVFNAAHSGTVFVPVLASHNTRVFSVVGKDRKPMLIIDLSDRKAADGRGPYTIKADGRKPALVGGGNAGKEAQVSGVYRVRDSKDMKELQITTPSGKEIKIGMLSKAFFDRFKLHEAQTPERDVEPSGTRPDSAPPPVSRGPAPMVP